MIVLTILKVIGTVLLVILLLILLLLGILLLVHVRYSSKSRKGEDKEDYLLGFNAGWLLHFLRFEARYSPDGLNYSLKLLWKTILSSEEVDESEIDSEVDSEEIQKEAELKQEDTDPDINIEDKFSGDESDLKSKENEITRDLPKETAADIANTGSLEKLSSEEINASGITGCETTITDDTSDITNVISGKENNASSVTECDSDMSEEISDAIDDASRLEQDNSVHEIHSEEKSAASVTDAEKTVHIDKSTSFSDEFKKKYDRILGKIGDIIKKIRDIKKAIDDEENRKAVNLVINKTKYLLRHYRFRKLKGYFTYGSEDPSSVGNLMAFLSLMYPIYGENFRIEPVFDREIIKGDLEFKGRIRLIHLLLTLIELLLNKKIRHFVFERI